MAKNNGLKHLTVKIGAAIGNADRTVHKIATAGVSARKKLVAISRQVQALRRQLRNNTEGLTSVVP
jgi:hypothetical protein